MLRLEHEWVSNFKSVPSNSLKINVSCCVKNLKFRTKNALFRYFGEQIEKDIAIFAIKALKMQSFMQNVRNSNLGQKLPSLDWHLKNYWHIWKSAPSSLPNCNILWKNENGQIWDQKCLIWVFLGYNLKTILSYLKSASSNLSNWKVSWNNENA